MKFFIALVALACANMASAEFNMRGAFNGADVDKNGVLSSAEFSGLFTNFDDNGDGMVNTTEFLTHFMRTGMSMEGSLYMFFVADSNHDLQINSTEVEYFFYASDIENDGVLIYPEYASVMNTLKAHVMIAHNSKSSLDMMFNNSDANHDNMLTADEFWDLLAPADTDGDTLLSEAEFVEYWMSTTMDNRERSTVLFHLLDSDDILHLGSVEEKTAIFTGFDYEHDGTVSREEFHISSLDLYSRVLTNITVMVAHSFDNVNLNRQTLFSMFDADSDMKLSMTEMMNQVKMSDMDQDQQLNLTEYVHGEMKVGFTQWSALYSFFYSDRNDDMVVDFSEVRTSFLHMDQNKDDYISMDEFNRALDWKMFNLYFAGAAAPAMVAWTSAVDMNGDDELTMDELKMLTAAADPDGDGNINKADFVTYWTTHTGFYSDIASHLFASFDHNMDGVSSEAERIATFGAFDSDKSGTVSIEEYMGAMIYNYAHAKRAMKKAAWVKFQGSFNTTVVFHAIDVNNNGVFESSENDAIFTAIDVNADNALSHEEFVGAVMQDGLSVEGALFLHYVLDTDDNDVVSKDEFSASFGDLDLDDDKQVTEQEYTGVWAGLLYQMSEASLAAMREDAMFDWGDKNKDGNLTYAELSALVGAADKDEDGLISEAEFKKFWMFETGEPADRTAILFSMFDEDSDGSFGNDQEGRAMFDAFDYTNDDMVSKEEFIYVFINLFTLSVEGVEAQKAANAVIGFFF